MSLFPRRPDTGNAGRNIPLRVNFFSLRTLPGTVIYHYTVSIVPDVPPAKNRRVYKIWEETSRAQGALRGISPVFDGRTNIYSAHPLPFDGPQAVFFIDYFEEDEFPRLPGPAPVSAKRFPKKFQMTLTKTAQINMQRLNAFLDGLVTDTPHDAISVLDVLLRHRPSLVFTTVGRCFYTPDSATSIANGAQLWQGFHQSLRPARGQMLINLDVSATAFYQPGPLVDIIARLLGKNNGSDLRGPISDKDRAKLEKSLKGVKVVVIHRGQIRRKYRINRFTTTSANRTMFPLNDSGSEESVANYFLAKYKRQLAFAHLPCAVVGDPARPVFLPLEVCEVLEGQRHLRKLNERQTAEMIKFTCQPPHIRSNKISAGITLLQQHDNDYLRDFGVQIDHEMATISARILPAPAISYHPASKEPVITPREGAWNLRDKMVAQGITLRSWCVVAFGGEQDYPVTAIQKFVTLLVQTCEECGVFVQNKQPPISYAHPFGDVERTLIDAYMIAGESYQERPQLIICILPNTGVPLYAEIKRVSDTVIGIATQCIQAKHMFAAKRQYCANVCLKMNVKLGGMNSYLSSVQLPFVSERPTIVLGADVTHPAHGSSSSQSIAAVVASMDAQCSRYAASVRVQRGRHEYIQDLSGMMIELLKTFYQTCAAKPERIVFYRDGVTESQFSDVLRREVEAIRQACIELEEGYRPTITFIVVQKRHHARFFPIRKEDSDRSGNVLPGTVVELGVTHPFEFDFYLCSHPGLQGTSKPTHYHVLFDENRFTSDSLQELTYRLCYLYCRATRSVSVVPPAYYAHLVAARARFHASGEEIGPMDSISVVSGGSGRRTSPQPGQQPQPPSAVVGGMVGSSPNGVSKRFSMSSMRSGALGNGGVVPANLDVGARTITYSPVKPELARVMYFM
ncbi:hypothetical protein HK105_204412 [Polyrhizophydium stewartii]|uniref:Piwi domain-containing protein n=1 Tax=Polyrhizophydium stewartii TaxID=2732419 RepID=A0ABR4N8X0_9FUNG|nr:hypothetical protein HK105_002763 [Polyrhizophydium stewartii]